MAESRHRLRVNSRRHTRIVAESPFSIADIFSLEVGQARNIQR